METTGETIAIGSFVPFSGPPALRLNAPMMEAGTHAAIAEFNARAGASGRRVRLVTYDSAYDMETTRDAARRLVEEDGVAALLNANGTPQIEALLPYLGSRRVPVLLPMAGADSWFEPPQPGLLGLNPPFRDIGRLLGRWSARDGHRRLVVLYPDFPPVSVEMAEHVRRELEHVAPDITVEAVRVAMTSEDGPGMADAVERAAPDAVIVLTNWPELRALAGELRRRRIELPFYSWSANVTQSILEQLGDLAEGMKGHAPVIVGPGSDAEPVRRFRAALKEVAPGQAPDFIALQTYAQAQVFTEALSRVKGKVSPDSLIEAFYSLDNFETGILPPVSFSPERHFGLSEVQPMRVENGLWTPFGPREKLPTPGDG